MSIRILRQLRFDFQIVKLQGVINFDDLWAAYETHAAMPEWAMADVINEIGSDVDVTAVSLEQLDKLKCAYQRLHRNLGAFILRRSGNVCLNDDAWPLLSRWLQGRHSHDGGDTEFLASRSYDGLHPLFDRDEIAGAQNDDECESLLVIGAPAPKLTESEFVAQAFAMADTGEFQSSEDLARALVAIAPIEAKRYLADDLARMLDARCAIACMQAARAASTGWRGTGS